MLMVHVGILCCYGACNVVNSYDMNYNHSVTPPSNECEEQLGVDDPTFSETWSRSS